MNSALAFVTLCAVMLGGLLLYVVLLIELTYRVDNTGDKWWRELRDQKTTRSRKAKKAD